MLVTLRYMIKSLLYLIVISSLQWGGIHPAFGEEPEFIVTHYLEAVKRGDVATIKSFIGGKLLERRRILLDQNLNYPEFLRKRYKDVKYQILATNPGSSSTQLLVDIEMQFPDGTRSLSTLLLAQNPQGLWQVIDQIRRTPQ